jgi:hypothetical protein
MHAAEINPLPIYPEALACRQPSTEHTLRYPA